MSRQLSFLPDTVSFPGSTFPVPTTCPHVIQFNSTDLLELPAICKTLGPGSGWVQVQSLQYSEEEEYKHHNIRQNEVSVLLKSLYKLWVKC